MSKGDKIKWMKFIEKFHGWTKMLLKTEIKKMAILKFEKKTKKKRIKLLILCFRLRGKII